jgi:hypothetical protein
MSEHYQYSYKIVKHCTKHSDPFNGVKTQRKYFIPHLTLHIHIHTEETCWEWLPFFSIYESIALTTYREIHFGWTNLLTKQYRSELRSIFCHQILR